MHNLFSRVTEIKKNAFTYYFSGLSMNYLNPSILATAATDGNIILWDLKSPENPIFQKKSYSPSDCNWLQQCYTLIYCSKGVK